MRVLQGIPTKVFHFNSIMVKIAIKVTGGPQKFVLSVQLVLTYYWTRPTILNILSTLGLFSR